MICKISLNHYSEAIGYLYLRPFEILQNMLIGVEIIWVQIDKKIQNYGRGLSNKHDRALILSCLPMVLFCGFWACSPYPDFK